MEARTAPITRNEGLDAAKKLGIVEATWNSVADKEEAPLALRSFVALSLRSILRNCIRSTDRIASRKSLSTA